MDAFSVEPTLLVRYGITGVFGALVQITILWLWVGVFGLREHYLWGVAIGFCSALLVTFPLQKYWTFRDGSRGAAPRQFTWYTGIALASLCVNTFAMAAAKMLLENMQVDFFHVWYLLAQAAIIIAVAGASFVSNRLFTFNTTLPEEH